MHGQETAQALFLPNGVHSGDTRGQVEECAAVLPDQAALPLRGVAALDAWGQRQDAFFPRAKPGRGGPCCTSAPERSPFNPDLRPLAPRIHTERSPERPLFVGERTCGRLWRAARYLPWRVAGSLG